MKVYISGKITGNKNYKAQFAKAQALLEGLGFEVINPAAVSAVLPPLSYAAYMQICGDLLRASDAIYSLQNWEKSKGAQYEAALATALGLKLVVIQKGEAIICRL